MKFISPLLLLSFFAGSVHAQQIRYEFAAPNAIHHEAEISVMADHLPAGPTIFRMSRSSPGRYATHEFGKNVYNVQAWDATGNKLPIEKIDAEVYRVTGHKGVVKVTYTLYGNYPDGTYAGIDADFFHLNMPATFMWVKGQDQAPITLHFAVNNPAWKIATQLKPTSDPYTFTAPGLQYFMDAPTKVGNLHMREWKISNPDRKVFTFRLALEAPGAREGQVDSFARKVERLVKEEQAVYGEVPNYDYGSYTFIASINPFVRGDGMEHRNSTMICSPHVFTGTDQELGVFAHEFFHNWNVERIRPKSLEPFNFEKSNMSELLWVAEGFTQYYGELLLKRAGFNSDTDFYAEMGGLINAKENTPGGLYYTPIENSQRAVFVDAGVSIDRTNYPNMFTSYYVHGGALALALDLQLRAQFNHTLDQLMQELWKRYGKTEKAYTVPQLQEALASVSSAAFAQTFFDHYVYHPGSINYSTLLQPAGLRLERAASGKAWIGNVRYAPEEGKVTIASNTIRNTPLYDAGLDVGDVIVSLDGRELKQSKEVEEIVSAHQPGDPITVVYLHHNQRMEGKIQLKESPYFILTEDPSATEAQKKFRRNWSGSKLQ